MGSDGTAVNTEGLFILFRGVKRSLMTFSDTPVAEVVE